MDSLTILSSKRENSINEITLTDVFEHIIHSWQVQPDQRFNIPESNTTPVLTRL